MNVCSDQVIDTVTTTEEKQTIQDISPASFVRENGDPLHRASLELENESPIVKELQAALFPVSPKGLYLSEFLQTSLRSTQLEISTDWRTQRSVARLREPRDLFALKKDVCAQQVARWPVECQVLDFGSVEHIPYTPPVPEHYYRPTGRELQPQPVGDDAGTVIYDYNPTTSVSYFSRSCVGGIRINSEPLREKEDRTLQFDSRFESGNLAKVLKITDNYYELYLRTDLYTNRHMQWFYFQIRNTRANTLYRLSIVNLSKPESLYNYGMKPLFYSCKKAQLKRVGWHRIGDNISYFKNDLQCDDEEGTFCCYTLTFTLEFPYDYDTVYLAHCYPYTYSMLQDYLIALQNHPVKSTFTKLRLLCRSLAGNNVYYLTITEPSTDEKKKKPAVVVSARVHPGETPASYMMKGLIDFLTGNSEPAKELRHKFIFKLIPMLNPDGVIVGNNRCSLTGRDLNRQYRTVIRETYPPVWHTKVLLRRLTEDCGIALYCDLHAHSRRNNIFIYGCESRRGSDKPLQEQVFPLMMRKNAPDKFCFESCKFRIQRSKEGTGRVVVWMMGVPNSYTLEASFAGTTLGSRTDTHFSAADFEGMGRTFCETLLDFCDDEPSKERLRTKIMDRLLKEGSSADEPTNINLSDYSSDEGDTSSCSDEEGEEATQLGANLVVEPPRQAWSVCAGEDGQPSPTPRQPSSPSKLSVKSRDLSILNLRSVPVLERLPTSRQSLMMPCATLDLPESEVAAGSTVVSEEDGAVSLGSPTLCCHRRHRRDWTRRVSSPSREAKNKHLNMPPELIVTQAQVYEACIEVTDKFSREMNSLIESTSLPIIAKRPPSARQFTSELHLSEKSRPSTWQQMRSIPVYRAYYESHRVLVQRQAVEERMTSGSPTQGGQVQAGHMWGLPPPRPKPKLQRQKSRAPTRPRKEEEEEMDQLAPPSVEPQQRSSKKSKLKSKFKKSSLITVALSRASSSKVTKESTATVESGSPVKSSKTSSILKAISPPKRKNKKLVARVQSTDF